MSLSSQGMRCYTIVTVQETNAKKEKKDKMAAEKKAAEKKAAEKSEKEAAKAEQGWHHSDIAVVDCGVSVQKRKLQRLKMQKQLKQQMQPRMLRMLKAIQPIQPTQRILPERISSCWT